MGAAFPAPEKRTERAAKGAGRPPLCNPAGTGHPGTTAHERGVHWDHHTQHHPGRLARNGQLQCLFQHQPKGKEGRSLPKTKQAWHILSQQLESGQVPPTGIRAMLSGIRRKDGD